MNVFLVFGAGIFLFVLTLVDMSHRDNIKLHTEECMKATNDPCECSEIIDDNDEARRNFRDCLKHNNVQNCVDELP